MTDTSERELLNEIDELCRAFGMTPAWEVEHIKQVAMNRHNVRAGRRKHVRRILDEAFGLLSERAAAAIGKEMKL